MIDVEATNPMIHTESLKVTLVNKAEEFALILQSIVDNESTQTGALLRSQKHIDKAIDEIALLLEEAIVRNEINENIDVNANAITILCILLTPVRGRIPNQIESMYELIRKK